jgi:5-(carboxyamino)imidazole ribonucleotide synthase
MMNLLGDVWKDELTPPEWSKILKTKGTSLHLYGKREARTGRKMGHITIMGDSPEDCIVKASSIRKELELPDI